jgi:DNA replication protein DnaC
MLNPVKVGILGLGTVGGGTVSILQKNADEIARRAGRGIVVTHACAKEINKAYPYDTDNIELIKNDMLKNKTECMPIIDNENKLVDVIFWDDLFTEKKRNEERLDLPVIIMAGGKGTRMKPLTNIIPKPLIPLDDKTIAEHIIKNFHMDSFRIISKHYCI